MRSLTKFLFLAVSLAAVALVTSSVRANDMMTGKFTLPHPTRWNKAVVPAGNYTFKLKPTQSNAEVLILRSSTVTMSFLVYPQPACATCKEAALKIAVQGDNRVATSMELAGYHVDLNPSPSASGEESVKIQGESEQVAVQLDAN